MGSRFSVPITAQEVACGFDVIEHDSGEAVVRSDLGGGIYAVKVRADDGTLEYVVCDYSLTPLYTPAKSLGELKERFVNKRSRLPPRP